MTTVTVGNGKAETSAGVRMEACGMKSCPNSAGLTHRGESQQLWPDEPGQMPRAGSGWRGHTCVLLFFPVSLLFPHCYLEALFGWGLNLGSPMCQSTVPLRYTPGVLSLVCSCGLCVCLHVCAHAFIYAGTCGGQRLISECLLC